MYNQTDHPNFINDFTISNFKSIKHCHIKGAARINLFIGRPNVGKSNILEALSVFSIPFLRENKSKNLTQLIRIENETELFNNGNTKEPILIRTSTGNAKISYNKSEGLVVNINNSVSGTDNNENCTYYMIDEKLNLRSRGSLQFVPAIKKYGFSSHVNFDKGHSRYLIPPYGFNLLQAVEQNETLKEEITQLFREYNLTLVFDKASQSLKIMQPEKNNIFLVPYSSVADTLQRIIFFKTAIAGNHNSVLLFEEPEAHCFPPFITHITQEMIYKKDNQYFVATHSPFILNDLLENCREDLSVYMVDYKNHETNVNRLTEKTLHEISQNGVDLFTNSETFI